MSQHFCPKCAGPRYQAMKLEHGVEPVVQEPLISAPAIYTCYDCLSQFVVVRHLGSWRYGEIVWKPELVYWTKGDPPFRKERLTV